ncbi:family 16 putative glycoside hydrolase [Cladorrhinum sp. PSN332]|nr:family 16 putative glycoside hydrolase [Cladorrhinum sp. PSN332]
MHNPFSPSWRHSLLGLVGLCTLASAQTYTTCNPITKHCPPDAGLQVAQYNYDFRNGPDPSHWSGANGPIAYTPLGAALTIDQQGDSPTLTSAWYFFFGRAEVHMRAAPGTGIVSCIVLESDDLDEIDWEWLGGEPEVVQTNYFGKGNTTTYDRGGYSAVADTQGVTHVYAIDWTPTFVTWSIDGVAVRTLAYADAVGGRNYPQTPMRLKIGIWAGGDPNNANGTITWAGGPTNYTQGPFTMYLESVSVTNTHPAASYIYNDMSGSWQSIATSNVPAPRGAPAAVGKSVDTSNIEADPVDEEGDAVSFKEAAPAPSKVPTPSKAPVEDEDSALKDDTHGFPTAAKNATGVASSASGPYPTGNSHPNHAASPTTSATPTSRRTQPPNLISASNSLYHVGLGVQAAVWGTGVVIAMLWGVI